MWHRQPEEVYIGSCSAKKAMSKSKSEDAIGFEKGL